MIGAGADRVVVGYDGSDEAQRAVEWAAATARRLGAEVEVVLAWESMTPWLTPQPRLQVEHDLQARAAAVLDGVVAALADGVAVTPVLVQGPAASILVERSAGALLLVVGAHGGSGVLPGLGSIAARVAVWSTVPAVVVPAPWDPAGGGPVVVGVDGSPSGQEALRVALRLGPPDTPVRLVHAWEVPATAAFEVPPIEPTLIEEGGQVILDAAVATVPPSEQGRIETVLSSGDPRSVLGAEAESAALVVVGSRGHSTILHRLLGSTVTYLLHQQAVPIVVVPEEAEGWRPVGPGSEEGG